MKSNVGSVDSVIRIIAGLAAIAFGYFGGLASPWNWVAMGVGAVLIVTALVKFCPAYAVIGANTCNKD
ncbi:MAG: DUF2892 domain-containing protein [Mariprofundaceae bacterium]